MIDECRRYVTSPPSTPCDVLLLFFAPCALLLFLRDNYFLLKFCLYFGHIPRFGALSQFFSQSNITHCITQPPPPLDRNIIIVLPPSAFSTMSQAAPHVRRSPRIHRAFVLAKQDEVVQALQRVKYAVGEEETSVTLRALCNLFTDLEDDAGEFDTETWGERIFLLEPRGMVRVVSDKMRRFPLNATIQMNACDIFGNLLGMNTIDGAYSPSIVSHQVVPALVSAIANFPTSLHLVNSAISGLACFLNAHEGDQECVFHATRSFVYDLGGVDLVLSIARRFPHEESLQRNVWDLFWHLANGSAFINVLVHSGALTSAAAAMHEFWVDIDVDNIDKTRFQPWVVRYAHRFLAGCLPHP